MTSTQISTTVPKAFINQARKHLKEDYLPKIEACLSLLSDKQIWWRPNQNSNSIGNLILHLCGNARQWIISGLGGIADERNRDEEFAEGSSISRSELSSHLQETLKEVDSTLAEYDAAKLLDRQLIQGREVSALEAIFHVTEHFSMHTGQIIQLTKILSAADLKFYEFNGGVPVPKWRN